MTLVAAALRLALFGGSGAGRGCGGCDRFAREPAQLAGALPGLGSLSSAQGSTSAGDGLCLLHGTVVNGRAGCGAYRTGNPASG